MTGDNDASMASQIETATSATACEFPPFGISLNVFTALPLPSSLHLARGISPYGAPSCARERERSVRYRTYPFRYRLLQVNDQVVRGPIQGHAHGAVDHRNLGV